MGPSEESHQSQSGDIKCSQRGLMDDAAPEVMANQVYKWKYMDEWKQLSTPDSNISRQQRMEMMMNMNDSQRQ